MARPEKDINWPLVEKYLEAGCNANEISAKFFINLDTFYRRFKQHYNKSFQDYQSKFYSKGEADIKLCQHFKALNNSAPGNVNMLIYLGKVRLGQKETVLEEKKTNHIDQSHIIMELENKIAEQQKIIEHYKLQNDFIKEVVDSGIHTEPETEREFLSSDEKI